jgi:hypothetical protein
MAKAEHLSNAMRALITGANTKAPTKQGRPIKAGRIA